MDIIINILKNYWEPIVGVLCLILSFILQLIRKKPINSILDDIYRFAILAVKEVEVFSMVDPDCKGQVKLDMAIELILKWLKVLYPDMNVNSYVGYAKNIIEDILSTPEKKVK